MHATANNQPTDADRREVVVVGGGQAGLAIGYLLGEQGRDFTILEAAAEPAAAWRERWDSLRLFTPARQTPLPQRLLGRDLFWYLDSTGLIRKTTDTRIGRRMEGRETLIGSTPRGLRRRYGVELHGRAVGAAGSRVSFEDGTALDVAAVIWATGFRTDYSWIDVPVFNGDGRPVHRRGVTGSPGLYFLGMSWQHTRGSALIGWVGDDAEHIARQIDAFTPAAASGLTHRRAA